MPVEPESDLHWTAFLYVAGDLSPDESSSFERLLAEDQAAREAVLAAVELAQTLAILGPEQESIAKRRATRRVLAWAGSLAAAACLLAMAIPAFRSIQPSEPDASAVAQAWSGLQVGADPDWMAFVDEGQVPGPSAADQTPEPENSDGIETSADRPLPSWLLSAASAPRGDAPQEEN